MKCSVTLYCDIHKQYVSIYKSEVDDVYQAMYSIGGFRKRYPIEPISQYHSVEECQEELVNYGYKPITTHYVDPSGALRST